MADYGSAAGVSAGRGQDRAGGRDGPAQETAAARVRLFNDLSAKPDICNPMTAGSPTAGSQMGSQRRQAVTDAGRPTATIYAGNWLIRRRPATVRDGPIAPEKRKVGGSTPPLTTISEQRKPYRGPLTGVSGSSSVAGCPAPSGYRAETGRQIRDHPNTVLPRRAPSSAAHGEPAEPLRTPGEAAPSVAGEPRWEPRGRTTSLFVRLARTTCIESPEVTN
jgi:hypothetical protein